SGCEAGSRAFAYEADRFYILRVDSFVELDLVSLLELRFVQGILQPVKLGSIRSSLHRHILVNRKAPWAEVERKVGEDERPEGEDAPVAMVRILEPCRDLLRSEAILRISRVGPLCGP